MNLIPMPKALRFLEGTCDASALYIDDLPTTLPDFVAACLFRLTEGHTSCDVRICVECGENEAAENYRLTVTPQCVNISADGYRGVFYAAQTLKQLTDRNGRMPCVSIEDAPDMTYRGFYHDVSRGRIPTLDTLKKLVDRLSSVKMNSLQLYVEHTHRFAEYVGINESLGFYTDEEILELDRYCKDRCVELIPSLSSFGHLYYLLNSDKYRHLCELEDYTPHVHNWHERLLHHTINPSDERSVGLIKGLIDQYSPLFTSSYFNICCDETFDLCKGRNAGKDVAQCYVAFTKQLISHLREKGKTVMMWGDIVMQHPEVFSEYPSDVVFLNWCYDANPSGLRAETVKEYGATQIVCPSVHSHKRFVEKIAYSLPNIANVAKAGLANGAFGILTTNWGDYGHICPDEGMLCGLYYSGAVSWNVHGTDEQAFLESASALVYRSSEEIIDILRTLNRCDEIWFRNEGYEMALWELGMQFFDRTSGIPDNFEYRRSVLREAGLEQKRADALRCAARLEAMMQSGDLDREIGRALVLSARGMAVLFLAMDDVSGNLAVSDATKEEMAEWIRDNRALWMESNKAGEWDKIETFFLSTVCGM